MLDSISCHDWLDDLLGEPRPISLLVDALPSLLLLPLSLLMSLSLSPEPEEILLGALLL